MTPNTFYISDTHFGHNNVYKFTSSKTGLRIRQWAKDAAEGDEILVQNWNSVVKPNDLVYHGGDVSVSKRNVHIVSRLNGRKILIRGNHDRAKTSEYLKYFEEVEGSLMKPKDGIIMTHVPIHETSLMGKYKYNIHGHTHDRCIVIQKSSGEIVFNKKYFNISVESEQRPIINVEYGVPIPHEVLMGYLTGSV